MGKLIKPNKVQDGQGQTLNPKPKTLNPTPKTLNPKPETH